MHALPGFFVPWEPSPTAWLLTLLGIALYLRGQRLRPVSRWRQATWWIGLALSYVAMQSRWDYFSEHAFFLQRLQHLVLHHLGPFLIALAYPGPQLRAGIPLRLRTRLLRPARRLPPVRWALNVLLDPSVAALLFVGLIALWLYPPVEFVAMLDDRIYRLMNWSMLLDGLLFWWLVLDPRPAPPAHIRPGGRIFLPIVAMVPQMILGAVLALTSTDWYPIYTLCGRAISGIGPLTDQHLGGLILWIPASGLNVMAAMVALRNWMRLSERGRLPEKLHRLQPSAGTAVKPRAST